MADMRTTGPLWSLCGGHENILSQTQYEYMQRKAMKYARSSQLYNPRILACAVVVLCPLNEFDLTSILKRSYNSRSHNCLLSPHPAGTFQLYFLLISWGDRGGAVPGESTRCTLFNVFKARYSNPVLRCVSEFVAGPLLSLLKGFSLVTATVTIHKKRSHAF